MNEKQKFRRDLRLPVNVEVRVRESDDTGGEGELYFDTVDLSRNGAFLRSELLFEEGTLVDITFSLPKAKAAVQAKARVVWVNKKPVADSEPGMGLELLDLQDSERQAIETFIRRRNARLV